MLLSKLNFYSELKSCGHWWLAWGKLNATWNFVYKLFYWHLSAVKTLIKWLHDTWDVHSCLFHFKLVVKRKGWSRSLALRTAIWIEAFIQHSVSLHQRAPKRYLLFEFPEQMDIIWKMRLYFLSKETIQWSSTQCCICSVHMRTEPKDCTENFWCKYHYTPTAYTYLCV